MDAVGMHLQEHASSFSTFITDWAAGQYADATKCIEESPAGLNRDRNPAVGCLQRGGAADGQIGHGKLAETAESELAGRLWPPALASHVMTYHAGLGRIVLFGGSNSERVAFNTLLGMGWF